MKIGKAKGVFGVYAGKIYGCHSLFQSKKKTGANDFEIVYSRFVGDTGFEPVTPCL
jgi:hypothetical protein